MSELKFSARLLEEKWINAILGGRGGGMEEGMRNFPRELQLRRNAPCEATSAIACVRKR